MNHPDLLPVQRELSAELKEYLEEQRKGKKTIAIVGFAPTTREIAPYDDPDVEIWALNEAYLQDWLIRWDRWFQIHKPWSYMRPENRNDPNHWLWLQNKSDSCLECRGTGTSLLNKDKECSQCEGTGVYIPKRRTDWEFPIYMQDEDPEVPNSERFPLEEIIKMFLPTVVRGAGIISEYFTSSYAYMCSFALYLWKTGEFGDVPLRIETYGFEMSTETEYHYQKGSTEFWMGYANALGVDIWIPEACKLLDGQKYGYEVTQMINRQELEFRKRQLDQIEQERLAALNTVSGKRQGKEEELQKAQKRLFAAQQRLNANPDNAGLEEMVEERTAEVEEIGEEYNLLMQQEINALSNANAVGGASQEIDALLAYIDTQYDYRDEGDVRVPVPLVGRKDVPGAEGEPVDGEGQEEETEEDQ